MEQLKQTIRTKDTQTIFECVVAIGGGEVDTATRMTRVALIDVYTERTSQAEAELLMDAIGL
jgi:hypothetical protein